MRLSALRKRNELEPGEAGRTPVIVQVRAVGRELWRLIGRGHQGPINVELYQPQRTDKLVGLDTNSGQTIFVAAQAAEKATPGLSAGDFQAVPPHTIKQKVDKAQVAGAQFHNVRGSSREHWPIEKDRDPEFSLKQLALGGFKTNLGDRYKRRLNAWQRLQESREAAKKRRKQKIDDGVRF